MRIGMTFWLTGVLLATPVFAAPPPAVQDKVWWRTDSGNVTEHRNPDKTRTCALWLYGKADSSISFTWQRDKPTLVSVLTSTPLLPSDVSDPHAVLQIGDQPIGEPVPVKVIGTAILFTLAPIDDSLLDQRLRGADSITVRTDNGDLSLKLNPSRMFNFISKTLQCRKAAGGGG